MFVGKKRIYLDFGSATPVRKEALLAMTSFLRGIFANPSAIHKEGVFTKKVLDSSRTKMSQILRVKPSDIIFTSGATESNNMAILGWAGAQKEKGVVISTSIEHSSIYEPIKKLESDGWKVVYLNTDKYGFVDIRELEDVLKSLDDSLAVIISISWINSDIGTIEPIEKISQIVKRINPRVVLHIDASQAGSVLDLKKATNTAHLTTISSSKIYGPSGTGVLIAKNIKLRPLIYGGGQEDGRRGGTENIAAVAGFTEALRLAQKERLENTKKLNMLSALLVESILGKVDDLILTGPVPESGSRMPGHVSFAVKNIDGEELVLRLDELGYAVSTGSACSNKKTDVSRAVLSLGIGKDYAMGSIRVTMGKSTTRKDVIMFSKALKTTIEKIRSYL